MNKSIDQVDVRHRVSTPILIPRTRKFSVVLFLAASYSGEVLKFMCVFVENRMKNMKASLI